MRIQHERTEDFEENLECTTRRQPIRKPDFLPRLSNCGYRYRRQPFIPQEPIYFTDKWPFISLAQPEDETTAPQETHGYDVDVAISRRIDTAQTLGQAIIHKVHLVDDTPDKITSTSPLLH